MRETENFLWVTKAEEPEASTLKTGRRLKVSKNFRKAQTKKKR